MSITTIIEMMEQEARRESQNPYKVLENMGYKRTHSDTFEKYYSANRYIVISVSPASRSFYAERFVDGDGHPAVLSLEELQAICDISGVMVKGSLENVGYNWEESSLVKYLPNHWRKEFKIFDDLSVDLIYEKNHKGVIEEQCHEFDVTEIACLVSELVTLLENGFQRKTYNF